MSSTGTIVLGFIAFLARMRAMFREVRLFAENVPTLHSISTSVIPSRAEPSDYADDGVIISIALNAELVKLVRESAVPQEQGRAFPNAPQIADPTKTPNSFGLPRAFIERLIKASRPGTGRIE